MASLPKATPDVSVNPPSVKKGKATSTPAKPTTGGSTLKTASPQKDDGQKKPAKQPTVEPSKKPQSESELELDAFGSEYEYEEDENEYGFLDLSRNYVLDRNPDRTLVEAEESSPVLDSNKDVLRTVKDSRIIKPRRASSAALSIAEIKFSVSKLKLDGTDMDKIQLLKEEAMVYLRREAPEATLVELLKDLCPKRQLMQVNTDGDPITTLDELFAHMEDLVPSPQADPLADVDDAMRKVFQEDDEPSSEFNLRLLTARYDALSKHGWTKQAMTNEIDDTDRKVIRTVSLANAKLYRHRIPPSTDSLIQSEDADTPQGDSNAVPKPVEDTTVKTSNIRAVDPTTQANPTRPQRIRRAPARFTEYELSTEDKDVPEEPKPKDSATMDEVEARLRNYCVENILEHKWKGRQCLYHVKWYDFPEQYNDWIPVKNFNDREILHEYWRDLAAKGLETNIPREFRP